MVRRGNFFDTGHKGAFYYPIYLSKSMQASPLHSLRILLIDDVPNIVEGMSLFLELEGHQVATASDAPGAIIRRADFRPDVVLLDLGLPGISGYIAAKRIREEAGTPPILIAMTGWAREEDR